MGCDQLDDEWYIPSLGVSIHAPTWGATVIKTIIIRILWVSIHAPTWGATAVRARRSIDRWFQSTHPHGVRLADILDKLS